MRFLRYLHKSVLVGRWWRGHEGGEAHHSSTHTQIEGEAAQLREGAGLPRGVSQAVPPMRDDRTISSVGLSRAERALGILLVVVLAVTLG